MSGMGGGAGRRIHAIEGSPFGPCPLSQTIREPVMKHINFHVLCIATFTVSAFAFGFALSHAATAVAFTAKAGRSSLRQSSCAMSPAHGPGTDVHVAYGDRPLTPTGTG